MWLAAVSRRAAAFIERLRGRDTAGVPLPVPLVTHPRRSFEELQHVLRLASDCPAGIAGDEIRRTACELIEAASSGDEERHRQRLQVTIAKALAVPRAAGATPVGGTALKRLADALRDDRPMTSGD